MTDIEAAVKMALEVAAAKADEMDYDLGPHSETAYASVVAKEIRAMDPERIIANMKWKENG